MPDDARELGRVSFARMAWGDAYTYFLAADRRAALGLDDLECAARAAQLTGRDAEADGLWQRTVHEAERLGEADRAARAAWWLGMSLMNRGDVAQAGGWFARARRLVDDAPASAARGLVMLPGALQALFGGDASTAHAIFTEALAIGERFGDSDLTALGRLGVGRSRLRLGATSDGMAALDDAMVAVTAGEVSPLVAGIVYCAVIEACHGIFDLGRSREWTEALSRWCDAQSDLVPFRGQCLVHRAEIMQVQGAWADALDQVQQAYERLSAPPPQPAVADALYAKAELHRLRGEYADAEASYREASRRGRDPQPGLAQLRLEQKQPAAAEAAIRRAVAENQDRAERARLLAAFVAIMLAVDDVPAARPAAEDLAAIANDVGSPFLDALSAYVDGSIALADGDSRTAIAALRRAWTGWCDLDAPYDAARARVLIGMACRELGDDDTASMEFDSARAVFEQLGAAPDLARLEALHESQTRTGAGGLTGREVEVLELIATGKTNRQIAEALVISEKTVARHVSNIFTKLGVSSRAAATSYAYRHGLT